MSTASSPHDEIVMPPPPGLLRDLAEYIYGSAAYPNLKIALMGSTAIMAGYLGNAFNVSGTGLNLYIIMLAPTGTGKEAVASADSRLKAIIAKQKNFPAIHSYTGPSQIPSLPGLVKSLGRYKCPSMLSILAEIGLYLKATTGRKADTNALGVMRGFLDFFGKSGEGEIYGSIAYSDKDKVTDPILAPAFSIFGEGTPEGFFSAASMEWVASGFLSRFLVDETVAKRPYENKSRQATPSPALVDALAALVSHAWGLSAKGEVCKVDIDPEAATELTNFSNWATDQINEGREVQRQLWNRAHLKALKLAAISAVGRNYLHPIIKPGDSAWAIGLVKDQTLHLIAKFENGETGEEAGDEIKQINKIREIVYEYCTEPFERFAKMGATPAMHRDHVIPHSYLSRRVLKLDAFRLSPGGATPALART